MTKPMYCPMSFAKYGVDTRIDELNECTPDCAWAVIKNGEYMCSIPYYSVPNDKRINTRPLKDDAE